MSLAVLVAFLSRLSLVALFLPCSALDKTLGFAGALRQAEGAFSNAALARAAVLAGLFVEVVMSLGVLTGVADRLAAFVLAGYCAVTALLFKQFWKDPDTWRSGDSKGRALFWDCLKNFAVAGGFLMVTLGATASGVPAFLRHPLSSTHPYTVTPHG